MYNNEIYPVRYPADVFYNQAPSYDYYGMPPEQHPPYPRPCPEYPPMPPMPPMPPVHPMPPNHEMPGMEMECMRHMKHLLEMLMDKKVALIIEGAKGNFDCVKIIRIDDCVVVVETKHGVCVIPLHEITAICMSKEVAEDMWNNND